MLIAKVVGNIWATRKMESLNGLKLMKVELLSPNKKGEKMVVVDVLSAGIGDRVIIALGSSARRMVGNDEVPVDAAIVGIVDEECEIEE